MAKASTKIVPRWRRWLVRVLRISGVLGVLAMIALVVAVYVTQSRLPGFDELKSSPNGQMIRVLAADGTPIVNMGPSYGEWLTYDQIPQVMKDAMIAVEDRRFESHWGVDPIGIARSVQVRLQQGRWVQGGSTITQQLVRNIFLNSNKQFGRKFNEWVLALAMERKFSKNQVLELYLNKVYFGGGCYGIDAASRKFFGHGASQLSLGEAAIIAGLVKAPSQYSPTADAQAAVSRAGVVIALMKETGKISAAEASAVDPKTVKLAPEPSQNSVRYFTDWALPQLENLIDEPSRPLEVWTTLDLRMQKAGDAAISGYAPAGAQGALISLDRDGAVRAMVGGKDYVTSNYNRSVTALRQPGSSFKLFVYLAALEAGHRPGDRVVDKPVTINGWSPRNSSGRNAGEMDIRTAFAYSVNTVAAQLGEEVGFSTVADMARRFGITTPIQAVPSMVLGSNDVRVIDMARAFASVANKGVAVTPYGITKVTSMGETVYSHEVDKSHVLVAPYVAAEMTDLLQTAVATGTGKAAQIGRPVAGKTGTTSSNKDGWFIGFSSGLTTAVWMGRDDARVVPGLQGGTAPARAFAAFMKVATAGRPVENFDTAVTLPDWQLDNESDFGGPDDGVFVDPNGNPPQDGTGPDEGGGDAGMPPQSEDDPPQTAPDPSDNPPQRLDKKWIDKMTGGNGSNKPKRPSGGDPADRPRDPRPQPGN